MEFNNALIWKGKTYVFLCKHIESPILEFLRRTRTAKSKCSRYNFYELTKKHNVSAIESIYIYSYVSGGVHTLHDFPNAKHLFISAGVEARCIDDIFIKYRHVYTLEYYGNYWLPSNKKIVQTMNNLNSLYIPNVFEMSHTEVFTVFNV
jgi:hypothetical protein